MSNPNLPSDSWGMPPAPVLTCQDCRYWYLLDDSDLDTYRGVCGKKLVRELGIEPSIDTLLNWVYLNLMDDSDTSNCSDFEEWQAW